MTNETITVKRFHGKIHLELRVCMYYYGDYNMQVACSYMETRTDKRS